MHLPTGWLDRLRSLRQRFLEDDHIGIALPDYWRDDLDLVAYDAIPAARIGWKWDAALAEAADRGLVIPAHATVLDFGCGTGIAARRFLHRFAASEVLCHDRSARARNFAVKRLRGEHPKAKVRAVTNPGADGAEFDVLLVSHVLGELDESGRTALLALARRARVVLWVEPGSRTAARALATVRDTLLGPLHPIAPCPHAGKCPTLANDHDWCHFFAEPPPEVFTTGDWVKAARELGIDLRALPYSFLALATEPTAVAMPLHRLLGRAEVSKFDARRLACSADGLRPCTVTKRAQPELWRRIKKDPGGLRVLPD
ncbi:MAG: methyltransferase domain-containing protein [Planctomycetes bacterium]|nr:methyltransferase domain-containing protein [Planctomycetota bacterium]